MKGNIILAWRNIWRNKRRTLITAASIFFAVFFALIMRSYQLGSYSNWIENLVKTYTGYIQIQEKNYWADKTLENSILWNNNLDSLLSTKSNTMLWTPRIEWGALASNGQQTKLAVVIGIDVERESSFSNPKEKIVIFRFNEAIVEQLKMNDIPENVVNELSKISNVSYSSEEKFRYELQNIIGENETELYFEKIKSATAFQCDFLSPNDNGVIVADRLARFLKLNIGDTIVLTGVGFQAQTAAGKFPVRGFVKMPNPDLDKALVYVTLAQAQELFAMQQRITSVLVSPINHSDKEVENLKNFFSENLNDSIYAVKDWKKMNDLVLRQIEADNQSGLISLGLLYLIIGFGVFGTVLMMTAERKREFGVMIAIGMQKTKLLIIVTLEMIFIGIIGILAGIVGSIPIIYWFHIHPIMLTGEMAASIENYGIEPVMPFAWESGFFINQSFVVILIVMAAAFYPIFSITRIKVNKALRA